MATRRSKHSRTTHVPQSQRLSTRMGGPRVKNARWSTQEHLTRITIFVVLALVALLVAGIAFRSCTHTDEVQEPQPFYNHANFVRNGQFYEYTDGTVTASKTGIDVADHQEWIDWDAVRKSGIQFAYIRIGYRGSTEGALYEDDYYEYNISNARKAGIECGVYFFSQAVSVEEAREEAEFTLKLLGGTKLEYPVVFDSEKATDGIQSRVADLSSEEATAIAKTFCDIVSAGGYKVCLYGNGYDLGRYSDELRAQWPIWYAEYGALPSYSEKFFLWQYASQGQVNGIETPVDLNLDLSAVLEAG